MGSSGSSPAIHPALPADHGLLAWNMPISAAVAATAVAVAGRIEFSRLRRVPACTATNLVTLCTTAGSTLTSGQCFGALWTSAGALVGQTTDQATAWASTGVKTMQLSGGPFALAAGDYIVGFWFNGTTGPTFSRYVTSSGLSAITNANLSAPNFNAGTADTGRTTTAPSSLGTQTGTGTCYFVALS